MPLPPDSFDEKRRQYRGERLGEPLAQLIDRLEGATPRNAYIGLLDADMYPSASNWRHMFSIHFNRRISVVATGRLIPVGVMGQEEAARLYGTRLLKLVKRAIGQPYFDLPRSPDPKSLMYSPLLSTDDLDRIGDAFERPPASRGGPQSAPAGTQKAS